MATGDTTRKGDGTALAALAARRQEAEERQAALTRMVSFGAALLITTGLVASVWYARTLAGPAPAPNGLPAASGNPPALSPAAPAAGYFGSPGGNGGKRRAMYSSPLPAPPAFVPLGGSHTIGVAASDGANKYVAPLKGLVAQVGRSDVARYWHEGSANDAPPPTQVLTAVDALESLTSVTTHPRRYPAPLRPYAKVVSLELRNYLKITALSVGSDERSGELQASATRHLDRCNQAITRLDAAARRLASGTSLPPPENALLP